jgi:hypothetical protein
MATQIVMDRTGDTRHNFDAKNADALLKAEERFRALTGAGFTAAVRASSGEPVVKRTFDPNAEETLFFRGSSAANLQDLIFESNALEVVVCTENLKSDHSGDEVRPGWRVN